MIIWIFLDGLRSVLSHQLQIQNKMQSKTTTFIKKECDDDKKGSKSEMLNEKSVAVCSSARLGS